MVRCLRRPVKTRQSQVKDWMTSKGVEATYPVASVFDHEEDRTVHTGHIAVKGLQAESVFLWAVYQPPWVALSSGRQMEAQLWRERTRVNRSPGDASEKGVGVCLPFWCAAPPWCHCLQTDQAEVDFPPQLLICDVWPPQCSQSGNRKKPHWGELRLVRLTH